MATAKKKTTSARQPSPSAPKPKIKESARVREMATKSGSSAMRKSQASYDKISSMVDKAVQRRKSQSGDLGGPNSGQLKGFSYGQAEFRMSRTEKRSLDQDKRAKTKSGKGYLKEAKSGLTFDSPYFLSKANDLAGGRTTQRAKDQAKRKKK